ncbi:hypothetical protein NDU88_004466 [Pleurodeles waltl]|uniref:Uncharacterized protein n=1 Tax=Pleurodeles waltl TaxID=8319 RepID=A0AAV7QD36_PLEWA|nr:hypothetical protein NDU88_004466 [Pleurodeles waltl]
MRSAARQRALNLQVNNRLPGSAPTGGTNRLHAFSGSQRAGVKIRKQRLWVKTGVAALNGRLGRRPACAQGFGGLRCAARRQRAEAPRGSGPPSLSSNYNRAAES